MRITYVARAARWIKNCVQRSGSSGCVVGLSGGVDSAVVAALCKKAVGNNLLCLVIPCESRPEDMRDALTVAKKFRLKYKIADIYPAYRALRNVLPAGNALASANLKPRLRMAVLYYYANARNLLVVGTGNKSEISVGYFTKYGDGGVDILPIGGLYKSEVVALARALGVPKKIIAKPPSAGLWEGQTDEKEMGVTYEEIEKMLRSPAGRKTSTAGRISAMMISSEHKRRTPEIFREAK